MPQKRPVLLSCYLRKYGDRLNVMQLGSDSLRVVFKGSTSDFPFSEIRSIGIQRKKLIIPLVLGGVGTTLSLLAFWMRWYHYETNLILVFLFFGWMYYGFEGRDAIAIRLRKDEHVFLLGSNSVVIGEFIFFIKEHIWKVSRPSDTVVFHITSSAIWEDQEKSYYYSHPSLRDEGFIHCSSLEETVPTYDKYFQGIQGLVVLAINPKWLMEELKWEEVADRGTQFPHLYGELNKSAVLSLEAVESRESLQHFIASFSYI